jgi:hypothetical protein
MFKYLTIITVFLSLSISFLQAAGRKVRIVRPVIQNQSVFNPMASYLDPESIARAHVGQMRTGEAPVFSPFASFEPTAGTEDLNMKRLLENKNSTHVVFQQEFRQLPIFGQQLRVHMDRNMSVLLLNGSYLEESDFEVLNIVIIKPQKAVKIAESALNSQKLFKESTVKEVYIANQKKLHRGYYVTVFSEKPLGEFVYLIEAAEGNILRHYNRILDTPENNRKFKNEENTSEDSPEWMETRKQILSSVTTPDNTELTAPFGWVHSPSMHFSPAMQGVSLLKTADSGELSNNLIDVFTSGQQRALSTEGIFTYKPDDHRYQEVMVYYYTNAVNSWLEKMDIKSRLSNLEAVLAYNQADNSFFSPGSNGLYFGNGGIPDAEDAQIILHEFGHAIVNSIAAILGSPDSMSGAMHEGFADYLAATWFNNPNVASWDSLAYSDKGYLRTLNNKMTFPENMNGSCHNDGQIWGGALWDLRSKLTAETADRLVFQSLHFLPEDCDFTDGLLAILSADETLFEAKNRSAIIEIFRKRGIRPPQREAGQRKFNELYNK